MFPLLAVVVAVLSVPAMLPAPPGAVVIVNSGSTNTAGYHIIVQPDGTATYDVHTSASSASAPKRKLESKVVRPLFRDLSAARSVEKLPTGVCMKSASFGTRTYVQWHGVSSPDLSCSSDDARVTRLYRDITAVEQQLGFPASAARKFRRTM
jgi:hypothetical protein